MGQAWAGLTAQAIGDQKWDIRSYVDGVGLLKMKNDKNKVKLIVGHGTFFFFS